MRLLDLDATAGLGAEIAAELRAGDIIALVGELGAGKTTLSRTIGRELGVQPDLTSPTFVVARVHKPGDRGVGIVHVDAYRLSSPEEVEDLDLVSLLEGNAVLIEWGAEVAPRLSDSWLEVSLGRNPEDEVRTVELVAHGPRWTEAVERMVGRLG